jgi:hypothetical protein
MAVKEEKKTVKGKRKKADGDKEADGEADREADGEADVEREREREREERTKRERRKEGKGGVGLAKLASFLNRALESTDFLIEGFIFCGVPCIPCIPVKSFSSSFWGEHRRIKIDLGKIEEEKF